MKREERVLAEIAANTRKQSEPTIDLRMQRRYGRGQEGVNTDIEVPERELWRVVLVNVGYVATNAGRFGVTYTLRGSGTVIENLGGLANAGSIQYASFYIGSDTSLIAAPAGVPRDASRNPLPNIILEGGDLMTLAHNEAGVPGAAVFNYIIVYERYWRVRE